MFWPQIYPPSCIGDANLALGSSTPCLIHWRWLRGARPRNQALHSCDLICFSLILRAILARSLQNQFVLLLTTGILISCLFPPQICFKSLERAKQCHRRSEGYKWRSVQQPVLLSSFLNCEAGARTFDFNHLPSTGQSHHGQHPRS